MHYHLWEMYLVRRVSMSQQGTMGMVSSSPEIHTADYVSGMARIFLCAPSLASYILEGEWDPKMPKSFQITPERIDRLKKKVGNMKKNEVDAASRLGPALEKVTL
jgi:hypothetical protein